MTSTADIGLIGLAVMGQNLVLNMDDHGYTVAVFNRTTEKVDDFLAGPAAGTKVLGTDSLEALVSSLTQPRKVMLMIKAGDPVDDLIGRLLKLLSPGDIIIDGGNSYFEDTIRRTATVEAAGMLYVGTGVSGGEEGARHGPSMMPGGSAEAWPHVKEIFQDIAAKVSDGTPTADWVGTDGAGHYVKMVHNGIEYGDMQVIAEAYHLMRDGLGMDYDAMADVFAEWDEGVLDSFLIDITADILATPRRRRGAASREDPRRGGTERNGEVDRHLRPRSRDAGHARGGSGIRPNRVGTQGTTCPRRASPAWPHRKIRRRPQGVRDRHREGALCLEDRLLRPGIPSPSGGGRGVRMGAGLRTHRRSLEGRLHHQSPVPRRHHGGVRG